VTSEVEERYTKSQEEKRKYRSFVDTLEAAAMKNPKAYGTRLFFIGLVGYAYIGFLLALSLSLIIFVVYAIQSHHSGGLFKIGLFGAYLAYIVIRSLFVRIGDDDDGTEISRGECPVIFADINKIAADLDTKTVDRVIIDLDVNASASELPRLGIFGWYRRTMRIGLPLLIGLSSEELRGIMAHEMGHFSGKHGRASVKIYRLMTTWYRLWYAVAHNNGWATRMLILPFAKWYSEYLGAHYSVFSRKNEVEADRYAIQIAGQAMALGLLKLSVLSKKHRLFFEDVVKQVKESTEPPAHMVDRMSAGLSAPLEPSRALSAVSSALSAKADADDSHPSITDRLLLAGVEVDAETMASDMNAPPSEPAYQHYLGASAPAIFIRLEEEWAKSMSEWWITQREQLAQARLKLDELRKLPKGTAEQYLEEAYYAEIAEGERAALEIRRQAYELWPADGEAAAAYGFALLKLHDRAGVEITRKAAELDPQFASEALKRLTSFYQEIDDQQSLKEFEEKYERAAVADGLAEEEIHTLRKGDIFVPHRLTESQVANVKKSLENQGGIKRLYIVRKVLHKSGLGDRLIVAVIPDGAYYRWKLLTDEPEEELSNRVAKTIDLPEKCVVFGFKKRDSTVRAFEAVSGSLIPLQFRKESGPDGITKP